MSDIESAEALYEWIYDEYSAVGAEKIARIEARDAAVALAAKREVIEEIRKGANDHLRGKGLSMSPFEAIALACKDATNKYTPTSEASDG